MRRSAIGSDFAAACGREGSAAKLPRPALTIRSRSVPGNVEIAMAGSHRPYAARSMYSKQLLDDVDLGHLGDRRPTQLSGDERQRIAIARALTNDPPILLPGEPTGSLDSASVGAVLGLFQRLRDERGITIVLVTHDNAVAAVADRFAQMLDGKVVAEHSTPPPLTSVGAP